MLKFLIIIVIAWFVVHIYRKHFKSMQCGTLTMIDGGVKCYKSFVSTYLSIREYKRVHRQWHFRKYIAKLLKRDIPEEPLLYSNMPLGVPYVPLTTDLILRNKRFAYGSVVLIDECSLLADSQLIKDSELNEKLTLFFKLFGHETGGKCIVNTHCIGDLHYAIKRTVSSYYYIYCGVSLPFFMSIHCREDRYSDDGTVNTVYDSDIEEKMKKTLIPKKYFKLYDSRYLSALTDHLSVEDNLRITKDFKQDTVTSFRQYKYLKGGCNNEKKNS